GRPARGHGGGTSARVPGDRGGPLLRLADDAGGLVAGCAQDLLALPRGGGDVAGPRHGDRGQAPRPLGQGSALVDQGGELLGDAVEEVVDLLLVVAPERATELDLLDLHRGQPLVRAAPLLVLLP